MSADRQDFYTVGIGTSAGGLEALEKFFSNMPPDGDIAFVVIQHLSPDYKSHMVQLLSKHTSMPVYEASDGLLIEPNSIYLLPRRKNMTVFKGKLYLVDYDRTQGLNLPIDIFLQSLAEDQREKAVGIILSGTGSDGTRGIRAIKEMGGMVMAQDESAKFDGMPRSAVATQLVDYIAPPEEMPTNLMSYVKHPCLATDPTIKPTIANDEDRMGKLFALVQQASGVDFTGYKNNTIVRRIERRMSINQIEDLGDYVDFLQHSTKESRALYREFLIGVTRFFRDPESFDFLQQKILPVLFGDKPNKAQLRIWVTACSTGEEAYSLAMIFREYMEQTSRFLDVKLFATDLDKEALEFASLGAYPESIAADVSPERLRKFFVKKGDTYEILRQVRTMVVFAHQNLVKDPPFSKIDLISCRNMLIYLKPKLQKKVMNTFQFALKPGGYLFLGSSETVGEFASAFRSEHNKWKIFQHKGGQTPLLGHTQVDDNDDDDDKEKRKPFPSVKVRGYRQPKVTDDWRSSDTVLRSLVEQVLPPCVVIDDNYMLIHGFGDVRQFLEAPVGYRVSLNLLKMVREELSLPLNTALHRTSQEREEVIHRNITLHDDGGTSQVNLITRPFWEHSSHQRLNLVIFEPVLREAERPATGEVFDVSQSASQRIFDLEQELQYTKENLQATIEELETANEELQATNEELLAANEELQSTNEELQSVNEELLTVNTEYQVKIRELTALNDDMNNLLSNTEVGTIFLDADLHLRKFTPAVQTDVNVLEQDIGRPFNHITHNLKAIDLIDIAQKVLKTLEGQEQEVQSSTGRWYQLKTMPYRTHSNHIDGVVITLVDITDLRQAKLTIADMDRAQGYLDAINILVVALDREGNITFINQAGCQILGYASKGDLLGKNWVVTCTPDQHRADVISVFEKVMGDEMKAMHHYENPIVRRDGQTRLIDWYNTTIQDDEGQIMGTLSSGVDITQHRWAEEKFRRLVENAPDAIVIIDEAEEIVLVNDRAESLFGYARSELLGQSLEILIPERLRAAHRRRLSGYFKAPQTRLMGSDLEIYGLHKKGYEFPAEISLSPLETEEGIMVSSTIRDMTERK